MLLQRMLAYCLKALLKLAALQKQLLQQFAVLAVGATALWRLLLLLLLPPAGCWVRWPPPLLLLPLLPLLLPLLLLPLLRRLPAQVGASEGV